MHVISIYNNKGGVGKSTLIIGIAEFLASNRKKKVLIIDLDAQASSSSALLGRGAIAGAIQHNAEKRSPILWTSLPGPEVSSGMQPIS